MSKVINKLLFTVPKEIRDVESQDERGAFEAAKAMSKVFIVISNLLLVAAFIMAPFSFPGRNIQVPLDLIFYITIALYALMIVMFQLSVKKSEKKK